MSFVRGLFVDVDLFVCVCVCVFMCVCVRERDVGQSKSHHCVLALTEFNSISVFLPSPSLHIAYRINCESDLYCHVCFEQSRQRGIVFRATGNYPSPWLTGLRVKITHHSVETLLRSFKPLSDWRVCSRQMFMLLTLQHQHAGVTTHKMAGTTLLAC